MKLKKLLKNQAKAEQRIKVCHDTGMFVTVEYDGEVQGLKEDVLEKELVTWQIVDNVIVAYI